jgi:hypothetical protein
MGEDTSKQYWVTVHRERRGPYSDRHSAFVAARHFKREQPNLHVAVLESNGISTPVE